MTAKKSEYIQIPRKELTKYVNDMVDLYLEHITDMRNRNAFTEQLGKQTLALRRKYQIGGKRSGGRSQMSRTIMAYGYRPATPEWTRKCQQRQEYLDKGMPIPDELDDFFEYGVPDPLEEKVCLSYPKNLGVRDVQTDHSAGLELDIRKLAAAGFTRATVQEYY